MTDGVMFVKCSEDVSTKVFYNIYNITLYLKLFDLTKIQSTIFYMKIGYK